MGIEPRWHKKNSITKQGVMSDKKMLGDIWGTLKTPSCTVDFLNLPNHEPFQLEIVK